MKIAVDGGALCSPPGKQFGTFRFTTELLQALALYGTHKYTAYSFCEVPKKEQLKKLEYKTVTPSFAWMKIPLPLKLAADKPDVFLAASQVVPFGYKGKKIVFSHGLSFYFYPEYYKDEYPRLKAQLDEYSKTADIIIVSSEMVKREMIRIHPKVENKVKVLPFGIFSKPVKRARNPRPYFLYVGSDQQIKNVSGLIHTFTQFWKNNRTTPFKLLLVGTHRSKLPPYIEQVSFATHNELANLYANATAYVTCSMYESFNFPVVEALSAGCPVVALETAVTEEQDPFVQTAETMEDLQFLFEKAALGTFEFEEKPDITTVFSWERYVSELEKLYI